MNIRSCMRKLPSVRRKVKFYYPGLITLMFLPFLLAVYLKEEKVFVKQCVLEVNMLSLQDSIGNEPLPKEFPWHRNYPDIELKGEDTSDEIKLKFVELQIKDFIDNPDNKRGIHLHFDGKAKYWALVAALNVVYKYDATYRFFKDNIWIANFSVEKAPFTSIVCGHRSLSNCLPTLQVLDANTIAAQLKEGVKHAIRYSFCWFLYCLMIVVFVRGQSKRHR